MKTFGERRKQDTELRETSRCLFQTVFHPRSESRGEGAAGSSQRRCPLGTWGVGRARGRGTGVWGQGGRSWEAAFPSGVKTPSTAGETWRKSMGRPPPCWDSSVLRNRTSPPLGTFLGHVPLGDFLLVQYLNPCTLSSSRCQPFYFLGTPP